MKELLNGNAVFRYNFLHSSFAKAGVRERFADYSLHI